METGTETVAKQAAEAPSWSRLTRWRSECFKRFGSVDQLPVVAHTAELKRLLTPDMRVLDIGCGVEQPLKKFITRRTPHYATMDCDSEGVFDYAGFEEMPETTRFHLMTANQILEHLTIREAMSMLGQAIQRLEPGGFFWATVPSPHHPTRYWADASHVTPWAMNDFYSVFRCVGFEVDFMARYSKKALPGNPLQRYIVRTVCDIFRMDWCDSLMITARKLA